MNQNQHNLILVAYFAGINLSNGEQGIFPSVYATDLEFFDTESEVAIKQPESKVFQLHFLGTMEVPRHKGTDILIDAIEKVEPGTKGYIINLLIPLTNSW